MRSQWSLHWSITSAGGRLCPLWLKPSPDTYRSDGTRKKKKYVVPFVGPVMMWSPKARMVVLRRVNSLDSPQLRQCGSGKADYPEWPHSCSPPPWLDEKMTVSVSFFLTPHASSLSLLHAGTPAVLWPGAEASIPAPRGDARLQRPACACVPQRCQQWRLSEGFDLSQNVSSFCSWRDSATWCRSSELQITMALVNSTFPFSSLYKFNQPALSSVG